MTYAFAPIVRSNHAHASLALDASRCWRRARDNSEPVQPALFVRLAAYRCGPLAPVFDGLLTMFEAASGRRFEAAEPADPRRTDDELRLLGLLDGDDRAGWARPTLAPALRIAVRSAQIMLRIVLEPADGEQPTADYLPIFFVDRDVAPRHSGVAEAEQVAHRIDGPLLPSWREE